MKIPFYIFAPLFVCGWIIASFILSRMGWIHLSRKYGASEKFDGKRLGAVMGRINGITYKNVPIIYYSQEHLYFKAGFIIRLFHPPFKVPIFRFQLRIWKGDFGRTHYELILDDVSEVIIQLYKKQGIELHNFLLENQLERIIQDKTKNR